MSPGPGVIAIDGLTRSFGRTVAVRPLALEIGPGGITGLLGPNGSGKSTLLRMLIGLVRPDSGTCSVDGVRLAGDGTAIRRAVTYVPGETHVYGELSELVIGTKEGRERLDEITVADLTGVGIQDAAVAGFVTAEAARTGKGRTIEV